MKAPKDPNLMRKYLPFIGQVVSILSAWIISITLAWKITLILMRDMPEALRQNTYACIQGAISLSFGVGLIWKVIDLLTPSLSFKKLSEEKPWLMVVLVAVILLVVGYTMKMLNIRSIPLP